jgi:superfamily II DNA helicase RecQ
MTESATSDTLREYVRDDESPSSYASMFHSLVAAGNFEGQMASLVDDWNRPVADEETSLDVVLQVANLWLKDYARLHINLVPADLRSALVSFEGQEVGEVTQNITFTMRFREDKIIDELRRLVTFAWRHDGLLLQSFRKEIEHITRNNFGKETLKELILNGLIPRLLMTIHLEDIFDVHTPPLAVRYALSRCFQVQKDKLTMKECGGSSSRFSALLHLLRAGICGYMAVIESPQFLEVGRVLVQQCRKSPVTNLLSPMIRRLRDMKRSKPPIKENFVSSVGDIIVGQFVFPQSVWCTLIPRIIDQLSQSLDTLIVGNEWKKLIDPAFPVRVLMGRTNELVVQSEEITYTSKKLELSPMGDSFHFEKLCAFIELSLHGLGCGSARHTEMTEMEFFKAQFCSGALYYYIQPRKSYTIKGCKGNLVEHKLPPTLSRIVLLYRVLAEKMEMDLYMFVPAPATRKYRMGDALGALFDFETAPSALQIRHFWASITNVIFPRQSSDLVDGVVTAVAGAAEMSGHAEGTHRSRYATYLEDSKEKMYEVYHRSLGDTNGSTPLQMGGSVLLESQLIDALRVMHGPSAKYFDDQQRRMIWLSANGQQKHCHVGLRCGGGKSMSWLLPVLARHIFGLSNGSSVVVLPYKFLLEHQFNTALRLFGRVSYGLQCLAVKGSDVTRESIPPDLRHEKLPSIIFMTIDALSNLLSFHIGYVRQWAERKLLWKFFIDEIHTIFTESKFRPSYECLRKVSQFGVPIVTLSGSLPPRLLPSLLHYIGMSKDALLQDVDVVESGDPVGNDFTFSVQQVKSLWTTAANEVESFRNEFPDYGVHVICANKLTVQKVFEILSRKEGVKTAMVTSESAAADQGCVARAWFGGEIDVLVSSTVALVGNENPRCRCILIAGFLFDVSSIIQAIGRLRSIQRGPASKVMVLYNAMSNQNLAKHRQKQDDWFSTLIAKSMVVNSDELTIKSCFSMESLVRVLCQTKRCQLQELSLMFGFKKQECGRCDYCYKKSAAPVPRLAVDATKQARAGSSVKKLAVEVLAALEERCLLCGSKSCDGDSCMRSIGAKCFRCGGGDHYKKVCTFENQSILNNRACFYCYDLFDRTGVHDRSNCRLQRRLRVLLFREHKRQGNTDDFKSFLINVYCEEDNWYKFVAGLSTRK